MRWSKRGLVLTAPSHLAWARTHAALPMVRPLGESRALVYFSSRDERNRAQIGRARLDLDAGHNRAEFEPEPVIRVGPEGAFDESGVTGGCLVEHRGAQYLYYSGWRLPEDVPFVFFVGCAISSDGETFEKVAHEPVLGPTEVDPFLTASPAILIEGGVWRMWYVSGTGWTHGATRPEPNYLIRYAESNDGIEWRPTGRTCIGYSYPGEHAIARPHVIKDGSTYRMWFSHRGDAYRLGYAESNDGLEWSRHDEEAGITTSSEGWDSEMVCYPWVGDLGGMRRMLYNGNGYGRTGIGMAVVERSRD